MLSGIHPILHGDLLAALDRLGHGDELVVADANFPAYREGVDVQVVAGLDAPAVVEAIRTVVPLDTYDEASVLLMTAEGGERLAVQHELLVAADVPGQRVDELDRYDFYERAATARLVVRTGELRPYGNVILRKGVVSADPFPGAAR